MIDITILGTTAGMPSRERNHPAIALRHEGKILLFDCGENTQRQMIHADLSPMKISDIFITHWHADHFAGLIGLLQSLSLRERTAPLVIYGPKGTKKFVAAILKLGYFTQSFKTSVVEVKKPGKFLQAGKYFVEAISSIHSIPTLAFKFSENEKPGRFDVAKAKSLGIKPVEFGQLQKGQSVRGVKPADVMGAARKGLSVVYSGDTAANKAMVAFAKNCDLLIHEATFSSSLKVRALEKKHSTAKQAAEIAKKANAKKLILTHISGRYKDEKELLAEAREIFPRAEIAEDFMRIVLKQ